MRPCRFRFRFRVMGWVSLASMRERVACSERITQSWTRSRRAFSLATKYVLSFEVGVLVWIFCGCRYGIESGF